MLRLATFFSLVAIGLGAAVNGRIVCGSDADIADFPFMLALVYKADVICGATVINDKYALTAASCIKGKPYRDLFLVAGSEEHFRDRKVYDVNYVYTHPKYREDTRDYNVGLLRVVEAFPGDWRVTLGPQRPPIGSESTTVEFFGEEERTETSLKLQQWKETIIPCDRAIFPDRMICAVGKADPGIPEEGSPYYFQRLLGGPLLTGQVGSWEQVGVSSYGEGCGNEDFPSVYTDTSESAVRTWLNRYLPKL